MDEIPSFSAVRAARATVDLLAQRAFKEKDWALFEGLIEGKRMIGIAANVWYSERFEELIDEQG